MLKFRYLSVLASTTSTLALMCSGPFVAQALAQQQSQGISGLEEITVTARRVEESVQRVPIAVQAVTQEKLQQQDIKDLFSLTKNIGGLNICCSAGNTSFIWLRGIGNGAPTYFADVPLSSAGYGLFFDLSTVQVLKGPQGTLFGQASNAGAFIYAPKKPGESFGGYVNVTGGSYGRRSMEGALDIPVIENKLLLRLAGLTYHRDGYLIDITENKDHENQNYYILRPSVIFRPSENIENYTIFQLTKSRDNGTLRTLEDFNFSPTSQLSILATEAALNGLTRAQWDAQRDQVLAEQLKLGPYKINGISTDCATPLGPSVKSCKDSWIKSWFVASTTTWDITENLKVKNIFGYSDFLSFAQPDDTDATRLKIFDGGSGRNVDPTLGAPTWSDEIQLQGTVFNILDLTVGTFHSGTHNEPQIVFGKTLGVLPTAIITKTSARSRAVYGQGNLDLSQWTLEGLKFTAGYRYTWDGAKREAWNLNPTTLVATTHQGGSGTAAGDGKWSSGSYTLGLQYQYSQDVMFFITNAKGFSSGGLQNVIGLESFAPDSLNNIEAGTKATFEVANMKLRVNASYFYGLYDNVKVNVTALVQQQPLPAPKNLVVVTQNAAKAKISGIDSDVTLIPLDWLEIGGNFAYTDARYTKWDTIDPITRQTISLADTTFSFTPKVKVSIHGTVHAPLDPKYGELSLTANYSHTGQMIFAAKRRTPTDPTNPNTGLVCTRTRTAANGYGPLSADGGIAEVDCLLPYHNLDLNLDWHDVYGHNGLTAGMFVTNVTKNTKNSGGCFCDVALGYTGRIPAAPRMFGLKLGYSF